METNRDEGKDFGADATHRITCPVCKGEGKIKCNECEGRGVGEKCSLCNGTGRIKCPSCGGAGVDYDQEPPAKCACCDGAGTIVCTHCSGIGGEPCSECNGTGTTPCEHCHGRGVVSVRELDEYCLSHICLDGWLDDELYHAYDENWEFWNEAAKTGSGGAAYVCGENLLEDGMDEALPFFRDSAKAGFVWGNYGAGRTLWNENCYSQAIEAFQNAALEGSVLAAGYLAGAYFFGKYGVAKDEGKAVEFSRRVIGSPYEKCEDLGTRDLSTFMKYLESAVSGDANALVWVAMSAYSSFLKESECLEILETAAAKGADNIKAVFKVFCSRDGSFETIKDMFYQEQNRKAQEKKVESKPAPQPAKADSRKALPNKGGGSICEKTLVFYIAWAYLWLVRCALHVCQALAYASFNDRQLYYWRCYDGQV